MGEVEGGKWGKWQGQTKVEGPLTVADHEDAAFAKRKVNFDNVAQKRSSKGSCGCFAGQTNSYNLIWSNGIIINNCEKNIWSTLLCYNYL